MGKILTRRDTPPVAFGEYAVRVKSYEPDVMTKFGGKTRIVVEIIDGPYKGSTANKLFGQSIGAGSKLYSLITALGIGPIGDGTNFDLDHMLNRTCLAVIKPNVTEDGTFNNLESWRVMVPGAVMQPAPFAPPTPVAGPGVVPQQPAAYPPSGYVPPVQPVPAAVPPGYVPPAAPPQPGPTPTVTGKVPNF